MLFYLLGFISIILLVYMLKIKMKRKKRKNFVVINTRFNIRKEVR